MKTDWQLLVVLVTLVLNNCEAVDRSKFRTCADTGFCRRHRGKQVPAITDSYHFDKSSVKHGNGLFSGKVHTPYKTTPLNLLVSFYESGSVRVKLSEDIPRWQPTDVLQSEGLKLTKYHQLTRGDARIPVSLLSLSDDQFIALTLDNTDSVSPLSVLVIHLAPLKFELYLDGVLQIAANEQSLMHFEHSGANDASAIAASADVVEETDRHGGKEVVDFGEDGLAIYADGSREEKKTDKAAEVGSSDVIKGDSHGGHTDTQKLGPKSVGIDFAFPYAQDVYGIPEHTSALSLPTTAVGSAGIASHYNQPYRLYNLDVFEYELDQTMALYGNIPLLLAHGISKETGKSLTSGVFWFNPSETFVDITDGGSKDDSYKQSHWISESGEIDFFLLPGPNFQSVYKQYTALTGTQQLPPMFSLAFHQCRWNYRDQKDVSAVESGFEDLDFPMDVIWLDIEHTDGKRYFTWDKQLFPTPIEMQQNVSRHGRKMVTIVDPHIKRDDHYPVHSEATNKGYYVKNKDGGDFDGWCWPGSSSYLDFTSPVVREWWATQFRLDKYIGSTLDLFTWNDMNEPSVFNGPEVSMPKDAKNLQGVEHREWHNLYGMYYQQATAMGHVSRSPDSSRDATLLQRPFVLTRAFWAGSQKHGAMWTGDNTATWGHLKIAAPMLLSINIAGLSFAGADVGGFFGDPSAELFTRWYQAGAFTPFFRNHAHLDSKRREPWVFGEPYTSINRAAAMLRYSLLPLWYTAFYEGFTSGMPVLRPMFMEYPEDVRTFKIDDQYMIGDSLLVKPVTDANTNSADVFFPAENDWFDLETLHKVAVNKGPSGYTSVSAPLEKIPVYIKSGKVLPRKLRLRRSSKLMFFDPYTLVIAPDATQSASGLLYMDDEHSQAHQTVGAFAVRVFNYANNELRSQRPVGVVESGYVPLNTVERVVIAGQSKAPKSVVVVAISGGVEASESVDLSFTFDATHQTVTIKKPDVRVADDWVIRLQF